MGTQFYRWWDEKYLADKEPGMNTFIPKGSSQNAVIDELAKWGIKGDSHWDEHCTGAPAKRFVLSDDIVSALCDTAAPEWGQCVPRPADWMAFRWGQIEWYAGFNFWGSLIDFYVFENGNVYHEDIVCDKESEPIGKPMVCWDLLDYGIEESLIDRTFAITLRLLAYLNSAEPDIIHRVPRKVKRGAGDTKRDRFYSYQHVGSRVRYVGPPVNDGKKLDKRFLVRGHWRMQACGPKRSERRRLWIKPHWKGPDTAEVVNRAIVLRP